VQGAEPPIDLARRYSECAVVPGALGVGGVLPPSPRLPRGRAHTIAAMLLQQIKDVTSARDERPATGAEVLADGRIMYAFYLTARL
jgi:hypothetical protein